MLRSLKTPIRCNMPVYERRALRPYLRLDSDLDETGRSVEHVFSTTLSLRADKQKSSEEMLLHQAEQMVDVPRQMPWQPRLVRLTMPPDGNYGEPNRGVLHAFRYIHGVPHDIDLRHICLNEAEGAYIMQVERSIIALETHDEPNEVTRFRVSKAALAAAGLRLAAATTIIDNTPAESRPW